LILVSDSHPTNCTCLGPSTERLLESVRPTGENLSARNLSEKPSCPNLRDLTEEIGLWNVSLNPVQDKSSIAFFTHKDPLSANSSNRALFNSTFTSLGTPRMRVLSNLSDYASDGCFLSYLKCLSASFNA
jgi:hypothetical protein